MIVVMGMELLSAQRSLSWYQNLILVPVLVKVAKSDPQNIEELKCSSCRGYSWDQNEPGISKFGGQVNEIQAKYNFFTIMACKNQRHL